MAADALPTGPLDQLFYYAKVVEHGGFAAAARALGIPKSRLSRHVNALEARLNVRLLQRSTRRFVVTELGQALYRHCQAMLTEAEAAYEVIEQSRAEPCGTLRVAAPIAVASSMLAPILPEFLSRFPRLHVEVHVDNRPVDVIGERFDAAIRVRTQPSGEHGLVMRSFAQTEEVVVASPGYLEANGSPAHPDDLARHAMLCFDEAPRRCFFARDGREVTVELAPRLLCHNFPVLLSAAVRGCGIALLPTSVVREALGDGRLQRVLPDWCLPQGTLHVVFPSRRGLLPSVRAFIDFLAERLPAMAIDPGERSPDYG